MTCLIALKLPDDRGIIAVDSCITWNFRIPKYEDTLQKLYGLSRNTTVGICGNLVPARRLLREARSHMISGQAGPAATVSYRTVERLPRVLNHVWTEERLDGQVVLAVLVAGGASDSRIFMWNSKQRDRGLSELSSGECAIYGSVRNLEEIHRRYRSAMQSVIQSFRIQLSDEEIVALASDALTRVSSPQDQRTVGVGGLFQIATASEGLVFGHGYDAHFVLNSGSEYDVEVDWDERSGRWIQRNLSTGTEVVLRILDECDFGKLPRHLDVFSY